MKIFMFLFLLCYIPTVYLFNERIRIVEENYSNPIARYEQTTQELEIELDDLEISLIKHKKRAKDFKHYRVKLTYYVPSAGGINSQGDRTKTAIGGRPIPGKTIAVSRDLKHLLRKRVHIHGKGTFYVNDLLAKRNPFTGKIIKRQVDICVRRLRDVPKQGVFRNVPMAVKI